MRHAEAALAWIETHAPELHTGLQRMLRKTLEQCRAPVGDQQDDDPTEPEEARRNRLRKEQRDRVIKEFMFDHGFVRVVIFPHNPLMRADAIYFNSAHGLNDAQFAFLRRAAELGKRALIRNKKGVFWGEVIYEPNAKSTLKTGSD